MSLYTELFYSSEINELFSDRNVIAAMLVAESALAQAQAESDIISMDSANIISACCQADFIDIDKLKKDIKLGGNAAIPLVQQLTKVVKNRDFEASKYVHYGATSQDIVDTGTILQIAQFLNFLDDKLLTLRAELIKITQKHKSTVMVGRTLLQQARPITFGLKTSAWLEGVCRSIDRFAELRPRLLVVQLAGAVGSQNKNISPDVVRRFAKILDLKPAFSWQSQRDNLGELVAKLGILAGSLGKIAKDVSLMMQTEVGEVFEGAAEGKGGSSTMPHKRNPVTCVAILANASRVPHLVGSILSSAVQEHERSAGNWHAEWEVLTETILLTAGSLEKTIELIQGLEVDEERMLTNIETTRGLIFAENVSLALTAKVGKIPAHEMVEKACKLAISRQRHLKEILKEMNVDLPNLEELFKAENSIGNSLEIIDEILK
jgi:3-carboxy-cis,cis-muconate cycloisomerase